MTEGSGLSPFCPKRGKVRRFLASSIASTREKLWVLTVANIYNLPHRQGKESTFEVDNYKCILIRHNEVYKIHDLV